jgi:uncharacterized protein YoxC
MNKLKSTLVLAILLATTFTAFLPLARASTGYMLLNTTTGPSIPIEVRAGENVSLYLGGVAFSGGQFYLVWSADGFSQISAGDFRYTPTFTTADLHDLTPTEIEGTTAYPGAWRLGSDWLNGTTPTNIAGGNYYVKCFDGSATSVAVTDNYITILGSFEVIPDYGPGGCKISIKGFAFSSNGKVNLSYYDPIEGETVVIKNLYATNAKGQFTYNMTAPDLAQVVSPDGEQSVSPDIITFYVIDNKTGYEPPGFDFAEFPRGLIRVNDAVADWQEDYLWGNETYFEMGIEVNSSMIISGLWFNPSGNVTFWFDGTTNLGLVLANQTGFFNKTVTIPVASIGEHYIAVKDKGVKFVFYFDVIPTLILVPDNGPVGTKVKALAYGFPEKIAVYLYWFEKSYDEDTWYWLFNATTGANGQFNVTVTFTVPHTYGGDHDVVALESYEGSSWENTEFSYIAYAEFTVTPTLKVVPGTFKNDGSLVQVIATGLRIENPWYGDYQLYAVDIDNQQFNPVSGPWNGNGEIRGNDTGDMTFEFVAAGFQPGLHVVSLYGTSRAEVFVWQDPDKYSPTSPGGAFALFTVTGTTPDTDLIMQQMNANQNDLSAKLAALSTSVNSLSTSVSSLNTVLSQGVTSIRSDIAGVKSDVAGVKSDVAGVKSDVAGVNSAVGTMSSSLSSKMDSLGTSMSGKIDSLGTSLGKTVSDNANSIQSSIQSSQSATADTIKKSVGDQGTMLIIIAILAVITLIVELAILIRRLS